ncbi:MAG: galactose-1-epimerase, partial [Xanthomonadales bacterium]|nr:galactose-1-epimerase [Xanthomonadales bacterium]
MNKQAIEERAFGLTRAGQAVSLFTLRNKQGLSLGVTNYGGTVTSLQIPDRNGRFDNVVLAYDSLQQYESSEAYFGALVGRFANRIAAGRFSLDGQDYQLAVNQSPNHLHGGERGFDKVIWKAVAEQTAR